MRVVTRCWTMRCRHGSRGHLLESLSRRSTATECRITPTAVTTHTHTHAARLHANTNTQNYSIHYRHQSKNAQRLARESCSSKRAGMWQESMYIVCSCATSLSSRNDLIVPLASNDRSGCNVDCTFQLYLLRQNPLSMIMAYYNSFR